MAETWDETKPAGTRNPKLGDDDIREFKTAIRERLAAEHHFEAVESTPFGDPGTQIGLHKKLTLIEQAADPVTQADERALYAKDGGGAPELFTRAESAGTVRQLTHDGRLHADGGLMLPVLGGDPATPAGKIALFCKAVVGVTRLFWRDLAGGTVTELDFIYIGNSAPPSPRTGKFWHDTANHILKQYLHDAWISIYNTATGRILLSVDNAHLLDLVITNNKIAPGSVSNDKLAGGIQVAKIENSAAGDYVIANDNTGAIAASTAFARAITARVGRSGAVRVKTTLSSNTPGVTAYLRIYRNGAYTGLQYSVVGSGSGSFANDVAVAAGDTIEAWFAANTAGYSISGSMAIAVANPVDAGIY